MTFQMGRPHFSKVVHRVVDMTAHVMDKIFTHDAHQILAHVANVVRRVVLPHVGIDGREPLRYRSGAVQRRLVDELDREVDAVPAGVFHPLHGFKACAESLHFAG